VSQDYNEEKEIEERKDEAAAKSTIGKGANMT